MKNNTAIPTNALLLIILAVIWGTSYYLMKKGLVVYSAEQVSYLRIVFSFLTLLPFVPKAVKHVDKKDILFVVLVAIVGSGIPSYLFPLAITKVDSSVAGIINSLTPVFTILFGWIIFRLSFGLKKVVGLVLAFAGAALLVFSKGDGGDYSFNVFTLLILLATALYGLSANILKSKLNHVQPVQLTSLTFAMIGPVALILLLRTNFVTTLKTQQGAYIALGYISILGILGTAIALVLFNRLIKRTDALYASTVTYLIPIVAIFWGLLDGEILTPLHFGGLFCILVGVFLMNYNRSLPS